MEQQQTSETQIQKEESINVSTLKGLVTIVLVLGIIAGGTAGALVSVVLQKGELPRGVDKDLSLNRSQTMVVEESSIVQTVQNASESVVSIIVEKPASQATGPISPFFDLRIPGFDILQPDDRRGSDVDSRSNQEEYVQVSAGTGFVVSSNGHILTNKHVVQDKEARYTIITKSGDRHEVEVLGVDPVNDLALIKTKNPAELPPALELGNSDQIQIGQQVIAIGNSLGEFSHTVTSGIISGIDRRVTAGDGLGFSEVLEKVIQTDAAINPGNSGGPLLNLAGQVIGVNTAVSQQGQLIGFAIPINDAVRFIEQIQEHGKVVRPYMGVRYVLIDERIKKVNGLSVGYGALLRRGDDPSELAVIPGSPADKAGLEENDILLEVDGQKVGVDQSLVRILSQYAPGDAVELTVLKNGEEQRVALVLGEFADEG